MIEPESWASLQLFLHSWSMLLGVLLFVCFLWFRSNDSLNFFICFVYYLLLLLWQNTRQRQLWEGFILAQYESIVHHGWRSRWLKYERARYIYLRWVLVCRSLSSDTLVYVPKHRKMLLYSGWVLPSSLSQIWPHIHARGPILVTVILCFYIYH